MGSVRRFKHKLPHWAREWVKTEAIGEKAAFEEAEFQAAERLRTMPVTDVNHQTQIPMADGPLAGNVFRVPTMLLRRGPAAPTFEIPIPHAVTAGLYLPEGTVRAVDRAVYKLDKQARCLRFTGRVVKL